MREGHASPPPAGRRPRLSGRKRDRLRAHHRYRGGDGRLPGRPRHRRRPLPRPDGDRRPPAQPGALDERRSARAGGHHRLRLGHQQARRARGHPHLAAQIHRAVLPGSRPRRPRRPALGLRPALAAQGRGPARLFHRPVAGCRRARARLAALPRRAQFRGRQPLPPSPDLHPLRADSEMEPLRYRATSAAACPAGLRRSLRPKPNRKRENARAQPPPVWGRRDRRKSVPEFRLPNRAIGWQAKPPAPQRPRAPPSRRPPPRRTWISISWPSSRNGAARRPTAPPCPPISCSAMPPWPISAARGPRISASSWP